MTAKKLSLLAGWLIYLTNSVVVAIFLVSLHHSFTEFILSNRISSSHFSIKLEINGTVSIQISRFDVLVFFSNIALFFCSVTLFSSLSINHI